MLAPPPATCPPAGGQNNKVKITKKNHAGDAVLCGASMSRQAWRAAAQVSGSTATERSVH